MNITPEIAQDDRPQPFATLCELVDEHGIEQVLEALADNAQFDSEDEDACACCRSKSARLALELNQLLERMADIHLE
jgi:hypothetical protein